MKSKLEERITELEKQLADMNRDCISLFLHEQRMKQLENELKRVEYEREAASALGHERIERLESRLEESQRNVDDWKAINESLQSRLKEAESVIKSWIDWEEIQIEKEGGYVGKKINELISAGRQYMEKVK
jgi:chromosome segregation ATPase